MRLLSLLLCLFALPASAAELKLVRVWPGYRPAEAFMRISEYFDGRENTRGKTLLRSQPEVRAGFYYLVRTHASAALTGVRFELDILHPGQIDPVPYRFTASLPAGRHVTELGLTGSDWPDARTRPVAWQLRVLAADGTELAREQSFLWSLP